MNLINRKSHAVELVLGTVLALAMLFVAQSSAAGIMKVKSDISYGEDNGHVQMSGLFSRK